MDLALNNLQRLMCHKTQKTNERIDTNSIEHYSFIFTQTNCFKYCYCLDTFKWFQAMLSGINRSIYTQLNRSKYYK